MHSYVAVVAKINTSWLVVLNLARVGRCRRVGGLDKSTMCYNQIRGLGFLPCEYTFSDIHVHSRERPKLDLLIYVAMGFSTHYIAVCYRILPSPWLLSSPWIELGQGIAITTCFRDQH